MSCKIKAFVEAIVASHPPGPDPGVVCVIIAREAPSSMADGVPTIDVEGCVRVHAARSDLGLRILHDFGYRLKNAVGQVLHDMAGEDEVVVLHDVMSSGVRGKA